MLTRVEPGESSTTQHCVLSWLQNGASEEDKEELPPVYTKVNVQLLMSTMTWRRKGEVEVKLKAFFATSDVGLSSSWETAHCKNNWHCTWDANLIDV
jgi:hypothetical protein